MSGNLATQDHLNSAVSQITSSLEEQPKEVRSPEASMVAGFERMEASFDAHNARITDIAEMVTARFEKNFETFDDHITRLEKRMILIVALSFGWALIQRVLISLLSSG